MKKFLTYLTLAIGLTACNNSEQPDVDPMLQQIVTYTGSSDDGGVSFFTYQVVDDSPLITLSAAWPDHNDVEPGTRLLAYYTTSTPNTSGPVELMTLVLIPSGKAESKPEISAPAGEPFGLQSLWRSGGWLNLYASVYFAGNSAGRKLYYNPETIADNPQLYIVIEPDPDKPIEEVPYARTLVASWDISGLSALTADSLTVNYLGIGGQHKSMKISTPK